MARLDQHRALVTGASSGIGREMARQLAAEGCHVLLAARRRARLEELAAELEAAHGVAATPLVTDLARPGAAGELYAAATADGALDICINNAGFGLYRPFTEVSRERNLDMVAVNVSALVDLSHRFVTGALEGDRRAYLLNVASTAAFQPVPYFANYAATKHYVLAFTEALASELRGTRVSATALCPGGTWTEFFDHSQQSIGALARPTMLSAERVAAIGLKAMLRGKRSVVSGGMNKFAAWMTRFLPRSTAGAAAVIALGKPTHALDGNSE